MSTRRKLLMAMMVFCAAGTALGLTPIGPPVATLEKGQFAAGFGYGWSEVDLDGTVVGVTVPIKGVEHDTYMANLIFGLSKDLELQIDLGVLEHDAFHRESQGDFVLGFVFRSTFGNTGKIKWGGATSLHWHETSGSGVIEGFQYEGEYDWFEMQIAVGPSYSEKRFCLYGGPFLHFIKGDGTLTIGGFPESFDFEQDSMFGGFVGARIEVAENTELGIEYIVTGSAQAVGASIRFLF